MISSFIYYLKSYFFCSQVNVNKASIIFIKYPHFKFDYILISSYYLLNESTYS